MLDNLSSEELNNIYSSLNPEFFRDFTQGRYLIVKTDLITIPELVQYISLREFSENDEFEFSHFDISTKIEVGVLFFKRDLFLVKKADGYYFNTKKLLGLNKFNTKLINTINNIKEIYYLDRNLDTGMVKLEYLDNNTKIALIEAYFYNNHRILDKAEHTEVYLQNLTDIDFNRNKFVIKKNIKSFILEIFGNWISTKKGSIPFNSGYFCSIKDALQVKNESVRFNYLESEIKDFFTDLQLLYSDNLEVKDIELYTEEGRTGGDTLTVSIILEIFGEAVQLLIRPS